MKILRLLCGDPASEKGGDSFGTVGLEATYPEKKIYIRLAKEHKHSSYDIIAQYYGKIKSSINPHLIIIEKNFDYTNLLKAFADVSPIYVNMSSHLTESTRVKLHSVDKPWVINEMHTLHKNHKIQYPPKVNADMQELINQSNEMSGIVGPSGKTTYKRTRNRHDDLISGLIIGVNHIIHWWDTCDDNP